MAKMKVNLGTPQTPNWVIMDSKNSETFAEKEVDEFLLKQNGASLPVASVDYRGTIFTKLGGTDVADEVYVCVKGADNTYTWKQITMV